MKKRLLVFLSLILLFILEVNGQNTGVNLCNINRECGVNDGICPELFFPPGVSCYIEDPDCCKINRAVWSSAPDRYTPITQINEGDSVYMYVETLNCEGKNANFEIFRVEENFIFADEEFSIVTFGPKAVDSTNKLGVQWTSYADPADLEDGLSKFKFKVRINPEADSSTFGDLLEVVITNLEGGGAENLGQPTDLSCSDLIDNDADGCSDETADCSTDGIEDNPDSTECSGYSVSCAGWKCTLGDCISGRKSVNCPDLPQGCNLAPPPPSVRCYEKSVPFPFFNWFNFSAVVFLLVGYYGWNIFKKKN